MSKIDSKSKPGSFITEQKSEVGVGVKRLIQWLFIDIFFALAPFGLALLFRKLLTGQLNVRSIEESTSEIIFFTLMLSVTTMGDIRDIDKESKYIDISIFGINLVEIFVDVIEYILIFAAVLSAALYGAFLFDSITGVNKPGFRTNLLEYSVSIAGVLFLICASTQVVIISSRSNKE